MAAPKQTVWDLEPHTRAKHEILRRYLQAWVPILSQGGFPEVLYIDGFAGPGRYSKGEPGSPVIALRAALEQQVEIKARILFLFVERDAQRASILEQIVNETDRPDRFRVKVASGDTFQAAFDEILKFYTGKKKNLPPTFAFIDPFGWSGVPFAAVQKILSFPSCEVLVTFMYEEINRFIGHRDQESNFDIFFGTEVWRQAIGMADPRARNRFLHDLYLSQLRDQARAKYVRSFEMRNDRDVTDYFLFYGTNSLVGLRKMKEAMWKVDESGEFKFSDATDPNQMVLFSKTPNFDQLSRAILDRFAGSEATVADVEEFVIANTGFRETHYKTNVLRPLELGEQRRIVPVNPAPDRRRGTYGDRALRLRFS
jgi:three-Cys-motif partner protein